jgi:hypothetical protein
MNSEGPPRSEASVSEASAATDCPVAAFPRTGLPNGGVVGKARGILAGMAALPPPPLHPPASAPAATAPAVPTSEDANADADPLLLPCTGCGGSLGKGFKSKKRQEHPLLKVPICSGCLATYESGEFEVSEEDKHELYCRYDSRRFLYSVAARPSFLALCWVPALLPPPLPSPATHHLHPPLNSVRAFPCVLPL